MAQNDPTAFLVPPFLLLFNFIKISVSVVLAHHPAGNEQFIVADFYPALYDNLVTATIYFYHPLPWPSLRFFGWGVALHTPQVLMAAGSFPIMVISMA
jgi:hypothetical protein